MKLKLRQLSFSLAFLGFFLGGNIAVSFLAQQYIIFSREENLPTYTIYVASLATFSYVVYFIASWRGVAAAEYDKNERILGINLGYNGGL